MRIEMSDKGEVSVVAENNGEAQSLLTFINIVGMRSDAQKKQVATAQQNSVVKRRKRQRASTCPICGKSKKGMKLHMRLAHGEDVK